MTRYLKDRTLIALGGVPDAELQRILDNQAELFSAFRQSERSTQRLDDTISYINHLAARLSPSSPIPR
jgi:hypothetical protein